MSLQQLTDQDLNSKIKSLAQEERAILHSVLIHIKEADRRKLYLTLAYPNLYTYLTQGCGYSEGGAQRRIDAARLMEAVPEVGEKIERGELNLTQVGVIQKGIRQKFKQTKQKISDCEKQRLVERVLSKPTPEAQVVVAQALDLPLIQSTKETFQKDESVTLQILFTKVQWEKIVQMREILSTATHSNEWSEVFEYVADKVIKQKRGSVDKKIKEKNESVDKIANRASPKIIRTEQAIGNIDKNLIQNNINNRCSFTATVAVNRKNIAAKTRRKVFQKDQFCQYMEKTTGKVCQSKWDLQIDHLQPLWANGSNDEENLQILCGRHNRLKYLKETNRGPV